MDLRDIMAHTPTWDKGLSMDHLSTWVSNFMTIEALKILKTMHAWRCCGHQDEVDSNGGYFKGVAPSFPAVDFHEMFSETLPGNQELLVIIM